MNNIFGVITKDRDKAEELINDIAHKKGSANIKKSYRDRNEIRVIFKDDTELCWINPSSDGCGRKLRGAWVDKDVDEEYYDNVIEPMLLTDMVARF